MLEWAINRNSLGILPVVILQIFGYRLGGSLKNFSYIQIFFLNLKDWFREIMKRI